MLLSVESKHGGYFARFLRADGTPDEGQVSALGRRPKENRPPLAILQQISARVQELKKGVPVRRRKAEADRSRANRANKAAGAATANQSRVGAAPRCSDVDEIILAIHEESGYQVSANAERLNLPELKYREGDPKLTAEYDALCSAALEDIRDHVYVTTNQTPEERAPEGTIPHQLHRRDCEVGDKERMTDSYQAVMKQDRAICACASCGVREIRSELVAKTEFTLEDLPETHWLRFTSDDRRALEELISSSLLEDGKLRLMHADGAPHLVDLRNIKSYFKSNAKRVFAAKPNSTCSEVTDGDAARRYFHVHPELVSERRFQCEEGEVIKHCVLLCNFCAKAAKDGLTKNDRVAPKSSIAKGVDYGFLERLCGLQQTAERREVHCLSLMRLAVNAAYLFCL